MVNNKRQQLVKNLLFDVEAIPQDNIIELKNSANTTLLNIKVRVRKKDDGPSFIQKGIISLPRHNETENSVERVRLASSDQTIMSFDMLLETDLKKQVEKKPRSKFFGLCLGLKGDDDDTCYLPNTTNIDKDTVFDTGVVKTIVDPNIADNISSSSSSKKDFSFGKCKPGGCLDPPFDEDRYAYQPQTCRIKAPTTTINNLQPIKEPINMSTGRNTLKEKQELEPVSVTAVDTGHGNQSILSLHQEQQKPEVGLEDEDDDSDSIITYPAVLSSNDLLLLDERNDKNAVKRTSGASKKLFNEFNTEYFSRPRFSKDIFKSDKTLTEKVLLPVNKKSPLRVIQKTDSEDFDKDSKKVLKVAAGLGIAGTMDVSARKSVDDLGECKKNYTKKPETIMLEEPNVEHSELDSKRSDGLVRQNLFSSKERNTWNKTAALAEPDLSKSLDVNKKTAKLTETDFKEPSLRMTADKKELFYNPDKKQETLMTESEYTSRQPTTRENPAMRLQKLDSANFGQELNLSAGSAGLEATESNAASIRMVDNAKSVSDDLKEYMGKIFNKYEENVVLKEPNVQHTDLVSENYDEVVKRGLNNPKEDRFFNKLKLNLPETKGLGLEVATIGRKTSFNSEEQKEATQTKKECRELNIVLKESHVQHADLGSENNIGVAKQDLDNPIEDKFLNKTKLDLPENPESKGIGLEVATVGRKTKFNSEKHKEMTLIKTKCTEPNIILKEPNVQHTNLGSEKYDVVVKQVLDNPKENTFLNKTKLDLPENFKTKGLEVATVGRKTSFNSEEQKEVTLSKTEYKEANIMIKEPNVKHTDLDSENYDKDLNNLKEDAFSNKTKLDLPENPQTEDLSSEVASDGINTSFNLEEQKETTLTKTEYKELNAQYSEIGGFTAADYNLTTSYNERKYIDKPKEWKGTSLIKTEEKMFEKPNLKQYDLDELSKTTKKDSLKKFYFENKITESAGLETTARRGLLNLEEQKVKSPLDTGDMSRNQTEASSVFELDSNIVNNSTKYLDSLEDKKTKNEITGFGLAGTGSTGLGLGLEINANERKDVYSRDNWKEISSTQTENNMLGDSYIDRSDLILDPTVTDVSKHLVSSTERLNSNEIADLYILGLTRASGVASFENDGKDKGILEDKYALNRTNELGITDRIVRTTATGLKLKKITNADILSSERERQLSVERKTSIMTTTKSFSIEYDTMRDFLRQDCTPKEGSVGQGSKTEFSLLTTNIDTEVKENVNSVSDYKHAPRHEKVREITPVRKDTTSLQDSNKKIDSDRKRTLTVSREVDRAMIKTELNSLVSTELGDNYKSPLSASNASSVSNITKTPSDVRKYCTEKSPIFERDVKTTSLILKETEKELNDFESENINKGQHLSSVKSLPYDSGSRLIEDDQTDYMRTVCSNIPDSHYNLNYSDETDKNRKSRSKESILLNLAFQTYSEENQTRVRTLNTTTDQVSRDVVIVRSLIRTPDKKTIIVPLDTKNVMKITIMPANEVHGYKSAYPKPISRFDSEKSGRSTISDIGSDPHSALYLVLHQELVPLQTIIKDLQEDIDSLVAQQMMLRCRLEQEAKRTNAFKKCSCMKRY